MTTTCLIFAILFTADPASASLDGLLASALKSKPDFAADWRAASEAEWSDSKKMGEALSHPSALPKPGDLKLAVARELIRRKRADDAWRLLEAVKPTDVSDLATYHFHRGGVLQTLGRNDDAVKEFLALEAISDVPERYAATAKALRTQLGSLKRESLPGIAHDMREIRRRLEIALPDQRTQDLNKDVVERLDKLICDCQKKADAAKRKNASGKPSKPAEESRPFKEKSTGEVADGRQFRDTGKWGDLPEKERAKALQDLSRDFPAHYRDAVEEYFKKLSKESVESRK